MDDSSTALSRLNALPANQTCADCVTRNPQWASVNHGIFLCLNCSGIHRSLGVHISFVRSATMDTWTPAQLKLMEAGTNDKLNRFLEKHGVSKGVPAPHKYTTPAALAYREKIKCEAEGREWKRPKSMRGSASSSSSKSTGGGGGGGNSSIVENVKKVKAPKIKTGQFDLATGAGSLITSSYRPGEDDGWRPPSPRPPRGATPGRFLAGLTPATWVAHLKASQGRRG